LALVRAQPSSLLQNGRLEIALLLAHRETGHARCHFFQGSVFKANV
jgi:hypothetical protein